ncbi:MAG: nucleotidyltransferase family protein [Prolixibacteraceae bacterium]|nr:nucleotidyltransferase family protein [Prolixibacteraceae bacterium]
MKGMIFAAGQGTRLKPLTSDTPKALVKIGGITLLERNICFLKKYGINDITINVHHFSQQIIDFLKQNKFFDVSISVSDESDELLGTGGGLKKAAPFLKGNEDILLINTDILTNINLNSLFSFHNLSKSLSTLVVRKRTTSRYLLFNNDNYLTGWENIKTGEKKIARPDTINKSRPYAFSGIQIVSPKILSLITENGFFSIIDLYLRLAVDEKISSFIDNDSLWMDVGKYAEINKAEDLVNKL